MQKVEGVRTVQVSLKQGTTTLELRPDNQVTVAQLRRVIRNNGFVPKEIQAMARGTIRADSFEVAGTTERLATTAPPVSVEGGLWRFTVGVP